MLLFGHLGITLGLFLLCSIFTPRLRVLIDPRYLAIGALLPDLIDKPLGRVLFASILANGRIIGHTMLFFLFLALIGIYLYKKNKDYRGIALASGSFLHLLEDEMWSQSLTLFWPLFGLNFPRDSMDYTGLEYLLIMFRRSFEPEFSQTFIAEILGIGIVAIFAANWLKKRLSKKDSDGIKGQ